MVTILADLQGHSRRNFFTELKFSIFSTAPKVTWKAFLGHFQCEDHPGHAVPDLPRPLARLWFHPCLISAEKQFKTSGSIMAWFFFYIISQKVSHFLAKLGAFLGHFQFVIILDMLFPIYYDPWPTFGSILA